jgi:hypothetical protein
MSIITGLSSPPIRLLIQTWETSGVKTLNQLNKHMGLEMNYSMYFIKIHSVGPPCLPCIGICDYVGSNLDFHIARLKLLNDDDPNFLDNDKKVINFSKRMKIAEILQKLRLYQTVSYPFQSDEQLQSWITYEIHNSTEMNANDLPQ